MYNNYKKEKKRKKKRNTISCLISGSNFPLKNAPKSPSTLTST
jgi:hypothetical protein